MQVQDQELLFIGEVETQSGIPIRTIRYYESIGLVKSAGRTEGGFRQFAPEVLSRLAFIKRAQSLGLSLEEIGEVLAVYDQGTLPCGEIKEKLEDKLVVLERQVEQLLTLRAELRGLLLGWQNIPEKQEDIICPILQPPD